MVKLPTRRIVWVTMAGVCLLAALPAAGQAAGELAESDTSKDASAFVTALRLTEAEMSMLDDVTDRVAQLDEAAFYQMLTKADGIASIGDQPLELLGRPSLGKLLKHPEFYRGKAIALSVRISRVEKLTSGDGLTGGPYWPAGRPVWKLGCFGAADSEDRTVPLLVFTVIEPAVLGEPDKVGPDGQDIYWGTEVEVAGLFYKVARYGSEDGKARDYPVLLAWRVDLLPVAADDANKPLLGPRNSLILGLVGLMIIYFFVRRWSKLQTRRNREYMYRSTRDKTDGQDQPRQDGDDAADSKG